MVGANAEVLGAYIEPLVTYAKERVPEAHRGATPFKILATAGMRLIPESDASALYARAYAAVRGFATRRDDVRTISGEDEAYFAALAVNYAFGVVDARGTRRGNDDLLGALDLGGASAQIAVPVKGLGSRVTSADFRVATFLGYGVERVASRYAKIGANDPCGGGSSDAFESCARAISKLLGIAECRRSRNLTCALPELFFGGVGTTTRAAIRSPRFRADDEKISEESKLVATSSYYYAWVTLPSVLRHLNGSELVLDRIERDWPAPSLDAVREGARLLCSTPSEKLESLAASGGRWDRALGNAERRRAELPRRCFDLAYVDILLASVFGLPTDLPNVVSVATKVGAVDLDWTLGVVLHDARRRRRRRRRRRHVFDDWWRPLLCALLALLLIVVYVARRRKRSTKRKRDDPKRRWGGKTPTPTSPPKDPTIIDHDFKADDVIYPRRAHSPQRTTTFMTKTPERSRNRSWPRLYQKYQPVLGGGGGGGVSASPA
ncbi:hypothetical protein CTAYLR_008011 [Chrysophaeum taylorii]|uniref:Uncharacterized protein n=1 Tax=Chrysophaeum taylorii TaxID=2483200 RepID=A0AAD7UBJ7_9STRA|nr:hypothetical protein CTAYLR_008011 [Chrysophaeum taylorii]